MERVRRERERVGLLADRWTGCLAEQFYGPASTESRQIELDMLEEAGKVGNNQDGFVVITTDERQHLAILGGEELHAALPERRRAFAQGDELLHPMEQ